MGSFRVVLQIKALQPLVSCEGSTADEWLSKSVCPSALIRAGQLGHIACPPAPDRSAVSRQCCRYRIASIALQLENLALRHRLGVLHRSVKKPRLTSPDRLLWAWLCGVWNGWRSALVIVKPQTVIAWHRKGFRLYWQWKIRRGQSGRPNISKDVRQLIRTMSRENPVWGAPRFHGQLLQPGIDVGQTSVAKYIVRIRKPPSQT